MNPALEQMRADLDNLRALVMEFLPPGAGVNPMDPVEAELRLASLERLMEAQWKALNELQAGYHGMGLHLLTVQQSTNRFIKIVNKKLEGQEPEQPTSIEILSLPRWIAFRERVEGR